MAEAGGLPPGMAVRVTAAVTPHTVSACGIACMRSGIACNMQVHGTANGWRPARTNFAIGCAPSAGAAEVPPLRRAHATLWAWQ